MTCFRIFLSHGWPGHCQGRGKLLMAVVRIIMVRPFHHKSSEDFLKLQSTHQLSIPHKAWSSLDQRSFKGRKRSEAPLEVRNQESSVVTERSFKSSFSSFLPLLSCWTSRLSDIKYFIYSLFSYSCLNFQTSGICEYSWRVFFPLFSPFRLFRSLHSLFPSWTLILMLFLLSVEIFLIASFWFDYKWSDQIMCGYNESQHEKLSTKGLQQSYQLFFSGSSEFVMFHFRESVFPANKFAMERICRKLL